MEPTPTQYVFDVPDAGLLRTFPVPEFPASGTLQIQIVQQHDEFTCLCPLTGQPDFGSIEVIYTPNERCLESKSWKLYLFSYRNFKGFHEQVVCRIGEDLARVLDPFQLRVVGHFTPRGGISFKPTFILHA